MLLSHESFSHITQVVSSLLKFFGSQNYSGNVCINYRFAI